MNVEYYKKQNGESEILNMIVEIENYYGSTIGAIRVVENNENGEVEIKNIKGDISIADFDRDYIFDTNEELMRIQLSKYSNSTIFRTGNLITLRGKTRRIKDLMGEYKSYEAIIEAYDKNEFNEVFILVTNYLGHIDYAKEFGYCKSHEEIVYILLENLLNHFDPRLKDNGFIDFITRQMNKIKWNLENCCHLSKTEIDELLSNSS